MIGTLFSKLSPARSWPSTEATVRSCQWLRLHDHLGGFTGHYRIKFTYEVGGLVNQGEFCHDGSQHIAPYTPGEQLTIQYDPKRPGRYRFNGAESNYEKLEAILVMTVFALIAGYVLYAF